MNKVFSPATAAVWQYEPAPDGVHLIGHTAPVELYVFPVNDKNFTAHFYVKQYGWYFDENKLVEVSSLVFVGCSVVMLEFGEYQHRDEFLNLAMEVVQDAFSQIKKVFLHLCKENSIQDMGLEPLQSDGILRFGQKLISNLPVN